MNENDAGQRIHKAFNRAYRSPTPGFEARMHAALKLSPPATPRAHGSLAVAAALLATVAVLVLLTPRLVAMIHSAPIAPKPTPTIHETPQTPAYTASPWSFDMTGAGSGWAFVGERVYRTTDDGATWSDVSPAAATGGPSIGTAVGANRAWLAVHSLASGQPAATVTFYRTSNGGASWQKLAMAPIAGSWLHQLTFVDPSHGWLLVSLGAATGSEAVSVWATADGGSTWKELAFSPMPQQQEARGQLSSGCDKNGISFRDLQIGWITGECAAGGYLYRTADGGTTWSPQDLKPPSGESWLGTSANVEPPTFLTSSFGLLPLLASAPDGSPVMVVYVTQDGGITWAATDPIPGGRSLAAVSPELWMATTASGQLAVTHDGRTYSLVPTDTDLSTATELSFADELHGLGILALSSGGSELVRTEDGGRHWQIVTLGG